MRNAGLHILVGSAVISCAGNDAVRLLCAEYRASVDDYAMFAIDITSLKPGLHEFEFQLEADEVELDRDKFDDIYVHARLDVREARILVMLETTATATLECDRTLRLFEQEVGGTYHVLFAPPEFVEQQEDAFDEVRVLQSSDQKIDLTTAVRDTILLSVPLRRVAPGAEEEEIETEFFVPEDDVDPRWAALRKLKSGAGE